jgi:MYXO-CTERM domain-containing protein
MARLAVLVSGAATLSILAHSASALAVDCFVDSVAGDDTNNGASETTAWKSTAKLTGSSCTVVKFKRGSEFAVAKGQYAVDLMNLRNIKTLTNYGDPSQPLPKFIKPHDVSSGGMLASYMGGVTIDGLYLSGSRSDSNMSNLADGICVMLGANSTLINSEITLCDIGIMTAGDTVLVRNNYVHDLSISVDAAPGVDPNAVGGAEGIFVNSSHVEVDHNRFINCSTAAQWVSGTSKRCDGGATEVTVKYAGEVTDVRIHHNLSYRSCGFFEVSSMFQSGSTGPYVKGKFTNSVFYDNVMIDSGWISLLQINNTKLSNVRWENNTIVHHDLGKDTDGTNLNDFQSSSIVAIPFNDTSSGVTGGGEISQGDIYWTNNVWYFDPKVKPYSSTAADPLSVGSDQFLKNVVQQNNLVFTTDPGFVSLSGTTNGSDFDLVKGSPLIDKGANLAEITSDFLDRPAPVGPSLDVGAFEYPGSSAAGGASGAGGTSARPTGGASATGGATANGVGGTSAAGASGTKPAGGAPATATGGSSSAGGTTVSNPGGRSNTGGVVGTGGVVPSATGGSSPLGTGGASSTMVATSATGGASTTSPSGGEKRGVGSCSCRVPGQSNDSNPVSWIALLMFAWAFRRRRHSAVYFQKPDTPKTNGFEPLGAPGTGGIAPTMGAHSVI